MPLPKTKDVGTIIKFLRKEKPNMDKKQMIAIALKRAGKDKGFSKGAISMALKKRRKS